MRPSPPMETTPPPSPNPPSTTQNAETVNHTENFETRPTHKQILSDQNLSDTYLTYLDHDLNCNPHSNITNPLPQLAHAPNTDFQKNSFCPNKSTVPSTENTEILPTTQPNISCPTHISDPPKAPESTTTPTYHTVPEKIEPLHGTWYRIGPPRETMNTSTSSETVLGPKRKQQDSLSIDDSPTNKKHKLLEMEAKSLGKLMVENLGSAVAAWQHHRMQ